MRILLDLLSLMQTTAWEYLADCEKANRKPILLMIDYENIEANI